MCILTFSILWLLLQYSVSVYSYVIFDYNVCDIVVSKNRGPMTKFHVTVPNPECQGLVRFKQDNSTYCIPIVNGRNDILYCPVSIATKE